MNRFVGVPIPFRGNPPGTQIKQTSSGIKGLFINNYSTYRWDIIKLLVLENVSLNSGNTKFLSNAGRAIDLSKITILNSIGQHKSPSPYGNIVIMSDGKMKTGNPPMKGNDDYKLGFVN